MAIKTIADFTAKAYSIFDSIRDSKLATRKEKVKAIRDLQSAINQTTLFLEDDTQNQERYKPNGNLSEIWLTAFESIFRFDPDLASSLRHKSNFWINPQKWLKEPGAMELVPKLVKLSEQAEIMQMEISK